MPVVRRPSYSRCRFLGGSDSTHPLPNLQRWFLKHLPPSTPPLLDHLPLELCPTLYSYLGESELASLAQTCHHFYKECSPLQIQARWNFCVEKAGYTERHTDFGFIASRTMPQQQQDDDSVEEDAEHVEEEEGRPARPLRRADNYPILFTDAILNHYPFFVRFSDRSSGVGYSQGYGGRSYYIYDRNEWNWVGRVIDLRTMGQQQQQGLDSDFWEAAKSENVVVTVLAEHESGPRLVHCSLLHAYYNDDEAWDGSEENAETDVRWTFETLHQNKWPNQEVNDYYSLNCQLGVTVTTSEDSDGERQITVTLEEMHVILHNPDADDFQLSTGFRLSSESSDDDVGSWYRSSYCSGAESDFSDEVSPRQERRREKAGTHQHKHLRQPPRRTKAFLLQHRKKHS